jgi:hypothetical protein
MYTGFGFRAFFAIPVFWRFAAFCRAFDCRAFPVIQNHFERLTTSVLRSYGIALRNRIFNRLF